MMEAVMKPTLSVCLVSALMFAVYLAPVARAEIKVGIAGPLSGRALTNGEQQEVGAQAAIDHLNARICCFCERGFLRRTQKIS